MKFKKHIRKFIRLFSLICICFTLFTSPVFADPGGYKGDGKIPGSGGGYYIDESDIYDKNLKSVGTIGKVADIVIKIFTAIGFILLIYGVAMFVMAYRNDNPEERHKATIIFVVALIFLGMRTIAIKIINKTFVAAGYGSFI